MSNVALPFKSNGDTTAPSSSVSPFQEWALSPLVASLALTVSACGFFDEREPTVYALLVGIDDYPGFFNDLRGPVEDVRRLTEVLTGRFGVSEANIMTLTDSDATRMNIANSVVQHLGKAGPDDVAVFFYSGHGTQIGTNIGVTGPSDAEEGGEGDEALVVYGPSRKSSLLLDEELGFLIESIDAGRSMVVVDACFSGDITRGPSDAPRPKLILADDAEFRATLNIPTDFIAIEISLSIGMPSAPLPSVIRPRDLAIWRRLRKPSVDPRGTLCGVPPRRTRCRGPQVWEPGRAFSLTIWRSTWRLRRWNQRWRRSRNPCFRTFNATPRSMTTCPRNIRRSADIAIPPPSGISLQYDSKEVGLVGVHFNRR